MIENELLSITLWISSSIFLYTLKVVKNIMNTYQSGTEVINSNHDLHYRFNQLLVISGEAVTVISVIWLQ